MLLCEVAAKPFFEQTNANYHADSDCKKAKALYVAFLSINQCSVPVGVNSLAPSDGGDG